MLVAVSGSITFIAALTAKGEKKSQYEDKTFELNEVLTHSTSVSVLEISTGIESLLFMTSKLWSKAFWNPILSDIFTFGYNVWMNSFFEKIFSSF